MRIGKKRLPLQYILVTAFIIDVVVSLVLGYIGFQIHTAAAHHPISILNNCYLTLQLFTSASGNVSKMNWALQIARFTAPFAPAGALIWVIVFSVREHYHRIKLRWTKDHVVICGLGRNGPQLVREFLNQGYQVVAVEINPQNGHIRGCFEDGANIVIGDASSEAVLRRAHVTHAKHLIAVAGDDGVNAKIAGQMVNILKDSKIVGRLTCHFHIVNFHLYGLVKDNNLAQAKSETLSYSLFNIYQNSARLLFQKHLVRDPGRLADEQYQPHLIIISLGDMGEAILVQAAKIGHFTPTKSLHITVVDKSAGALLKQILHRHPGLQQVCKIDTIDADVTDHERQSEIARLACDKNSPAVIAFCFGNDYLNLTCALEMSKLISNEEVTLLVRINRHAGYGTLIEQEMSTAQSPPRCAIYPFGWVESTSTSETLLAGSLDAIAGQLYRNDKPDGSEWKAISEQEKDIYRQRADHIYVKLMMIGRTVGKDQSGSFDTITEGEIKVMADAEIARRAAEEKLRMSRSGNNSQGQPTHQVTEADMKAVREIIKMLGESGSSQST